MEQITNFFYNDKVFIIFQLLTIIALIILVFHQRKLLKLERKYKDHQLLDDKIYNNQSSK